MVTAKDIMSTTPYALPPETSVLEFARQMEENHLSGAVVMEEGGKLAGVVTESDLIDQHKRLHLPTVITLFDSVLSFGAQKVNEEMKKMAGSTVSDIMTKKVIVVNEDTPLDEIATIMAEEKKHHIPVMRDGKLVGIIDRSHVIRAIIKDA